MIKIEFEKNKNITIRQIKEVASIFMRIIINEELKPGDLYLANIDNTVCLMKCNSIEEGLVYPVDIGPSCNIEKCYKIK